MSITTDKLQLDLVAAMKGKDALKVSTIRMARTAIHNKEIDKRGSLEESEVQAILSTMVKQRKDSFDQFLAGNRPELAEKEAAEIDILRVYMPRELTLEEMNELVAKTITHLADTLNRTLTPKDMGLVMKTCQSWLAENNVRADGKLLSSHVKVML